MYFVVLGKFGSPRIRMFKVEPSLWPLDLGVDLFRPVGRGYLRVLEDSGSPRIGTRLLSTWFSPPIERFPGVWPLSHAEQLRGATGES
jgi:hypothetical protein